MWRSRKLILVAILIAVVLSASALVTSCTSTGGEDERVPGASQDGGPPEGVSPSPGLPSDLLARVAEILGIDQQTLEDAFNQAQSEISGGTAPPSSNQQ
jgi:predicted small secreted protein